MAKRGLLERGIVLLVPDDDARDATLSLPDVTELHYSFPDECIACGAAPTQHRILRQDQTRIHTSGPVHGKVTTTTTRIRFAIVGARYCDEHAPPDVIAEAAIKVFASDWPGIKSIQWDAGLFTLHFARPEFAGRFANSNLDAIAHTASRLPGMTTTKQEKGFADEVLQLLAERDDDHAITLYADLIATRTFAPSVLSDSARALAAHGNRAAELLLRRLDKGFNGNVIAALAAFDEPAVEHRVVEALLPRLLDDTGEREVKGLQARTNRLMNALPRVFAARSLARYIHVPGVAEALQRAQSDDSTPDVRKAAARALKAKSR